MNPHEQLRSLQELVKSDGWRIFLATVMQQQDEMVRAVIVTPLSSFDGALAQEFQKGAISRTEQILTLPETLVEQLKLDIQRMEKSNVEETSDAS